MEVEELCTGYFIGDVISYLKHTHIGMYRCKLWVLSLQLVGLIKAHTYMHTLMHTYLNAFTHTGISTSQSYS